MLPRRSGVVRIKSKNKVIVELRERENGGESGPKAVKGPGERHQEARLLPSLLGSTHQRFKAEAPAAVPLLAVLHALILVQTCI